MKAGTVEEYEKEFEDISESRILAHMLRRYEQEYGDAIKKKLELDQQVLDLTNLITAAKKVLNRRQEYVNVKERGLNK